MSEKDPVTALWKTVLLQFLCPPQSKTLNLAKTTKKTLKENRALSTTLS